MTERQYILATRLASVRNAETIVRDLGPASIIPGIDEQEYQTVARFLSEWSDILDAQLRREMHPDDDDDQHI